MNKIQNESNGRLRLVGYLIPYVTFREPIESRHPRLSLSLPHVTPDGELQLEYVHAKRFGAGPPSQMLETKCSMVLVTRKDDGLCPDRRAAQQVADAFLAALTTVDARLYYAPEDFVVLGLPEGVWDPESGVADIAAITEETYPWEYDSGLSGPIALLKITREWCELFPHWTNVLRLSDIGLAVPWLLRAMQYLAESKSQAQFFGDDALHLEREPSIRPNLVADEIRFETAFWLAHKSVETVAGGPLSQDAAGIRRTLVKRGVPAGLFAWDPSGKTLPGILDEYRGMRDAKSAHGGMRSEAISPFELMDYQQFVRSFILEVADVQAKRASLPALLDW